MSAERSDAAPRPAIVLVRPQEEGNVGAAARAMANFGLSRLLLVEPATPIRATARAFAVHAGALLDRVERHPDLRSALAGFERVVATTAARDRPWPMRLETPRALAEEIAAEAEPRATAFVFGPEPSGLTNAELALANRLVSIPSSPEQPTLNLGQAVVVVAHELFTADLAAPRRESAERPEPAATAAEIDGLFEHWSALLRDAGFARDTTWEGVERDLRRLVARAAPTRREATLLRGAARRLAHALGTAERDDRPTDG